MALIVSPEHVTLWQGEVDFWRLATPEEAARFWAKWADEDDEPPADLAPLLQALEV